MEIIGLKHKITWVALTEFDLSYPKMGIYGSGFRA